MKITMAHGSGGKETSDLISAVFARHFTNPVLDRMEDSAVVQGSSRLAVTTDSFVVQPVFFPGGDLGKLAVCGTVNDLLMSGARPRYLTCGWILQEGASLEEVDRIAESMSRTAQEAGVSIVAGDTKVIEGNGQIFINTAGVGFVPENCEIGAAKCQAGDRILISGTLGDHHAAILSARMEIENEIQSDCAPLLDIVRNLQKEKIRIRAMRDITRGGLATILNEFAKSSGLGMELEEEQIPVSEAVRGFCGILGLDPLYMGNEGKMAVVVAEEDAGRALSIMRSSQYGAQAAEVGTVRTDDAARAVVRTRVGGIRVLPELYGEGLPRIC